jgi:hypothetical protein
MISQILILAANWAFLWSWVVSVLSEFGRFWNSLTELQIAAGISALVLTIGAIVEEWHNLSRLTLIGLKWICKKSTPFDRCVFKKLLVHSIGPLFVVFGIGGELVFEGRAFIVEDTQEQRARELVGSLQIEAGDAESKAQSALNKASTANDLAGTAQHKAETANASAGEARQKADDIGKEANDLSVKLAKAEAEELAARKKEDELQKSLTPRILEITGDPTSKYNTSSLLPFSNTEVVMEVIADAEAIRAAKSLAQTLKMTCHWKVVLPIQVKSPESIPDGITIYSYFLHREDLPPEYDKSREAAETLV